MKLGILGTPGSGTGTGALVRSQPATAPILSYRPEWWITDSFDGPEDTYVHLMKDSANCIDRSSMPREARALVLGWRFTRVKSIVEVRQKP